MQWLRLLGFGLLACITFRCKPPGESTNRIQSIFNGDSTRSRIVAAEKLLAQWDFRQAQHEFHAISDLSDLEPGERDYVLENEALCAQLSMDTPDCIFPSSEVKGPAALVRALNQFICDPANRVDDLRRSIGTMESRNQRNSIHYLIALEKLTWYNYTYVSKIDTAIAHCKHALSVAESIDEFQPHRGYLLYTLAELSLTLRDVRAGFSYVQRGLKLNTLPSMEGRLVGLKGTLYRRLRKYDSAAFFYSQAEAICARQGNDGVLSEVLRERALMAIIVRNDSAFSGVMNQLNDIDSTKRSQKVNADRLFGFYYFWNKRFQPCIDHYEKALKVLERQYDLDIVQIGEAHYTLIEFYRETKQFEKAELYCFKSLISSTPFQSVPYTWEILVSPALYSSWPNSFVMYGLLADTYYAHYQNDRQPDLLEKAFDLYRLSDKIMERQLRANEEEASLNYAAAVGDRMYAGGVAACYELYSRTRDTVYLHQAHRFMERSKAMIVYRDILMRHADYFPEVPTKLRERDLELKSRIEFLKGTGAVSSKELEELLEEQRKNSEEVRAKYPAFYTSLFELSIPSFSNCVAMGRNEKVSIIQFHSTQDHIYTLTYSEPYAFVRIPRDSAFNTDIQKFKELVSLPPRLGQKANFGRLTRASNDLYKRLILPLGAIKNPMVVIADGTLTQIPFEALISMPDDDLKSCRYLIQNNEVNYAYSLKVFMLNPSVKRFIIHNILGYSYSSSEGKTDEDGLLPALPGAATELKSIRKSFPEGNLVFRFGKEARKDRFMVDLQDPFDVVHVAMHASSSSTNRLDNKIYFGNEERSLDTLYASEIVSRKIPAELVVLTGCSTSTGTWVRGEGVYTLARAFHRAGAKKVVASLWPLPDQSSATISANFYSYLKKGKSVTESLRLAKMDFLKNSDSNLAHPFFWAGLICL